MNSIKIFLIFLIISFFNACSEKEKDIQINPNSSNPENNELLGDWNLFAILADPGDGSGTFNPISSEDIVSFFEDKTFISTNDLCLLIPSSHSSGSGTYSLAEQVIIPNNCAYDSKLSFELDNDTLIIQIQCIEACALKYQRVTYSDL